MIDHHPSRSEANTMAEITGFQPGPISTVTAQPPFSLGPAIQPEFDPIDLLPEGGAQNRLRKMRVRRDDAHAVCVPFSEIQFASAQKQDADRALRKLVDHRSLRGYELPPDDSRVVLAEKHLAKVSDDFRRLQERAEMRSAAWQAASAPVAACEDWLRHGVPGGTTLQDFDGPEAKLLKGENGLLDAIENRRRRVREIKASIHTIRSSCYPSSYCKQRLREMVAQLAARSVPDISSLIEHDQDVQWPMQRVQSQVIGAERSLAFHEAVDVVGLLAFLFAPAMITALDALVDAEKDDKNSLSHEERQRRESEALSDLRAIEFEESSLVFRAQSEGLPCEHRADCAPQCILGVQLLVSPHANEAPGTTPGYSWPMRRDTDRAAGAAAACVLSGCTGAGPVCRAAVPRHL
jgi:hypothetical protein